MMKETLKDKVVFISGGSRGIGREIALTFAKEGAKIVIAAKTAEQHATLAGTIYTVAKEIEQAGGQALPLQVDIRDEAQVYAAVAKAVEVWGGIDILINNASAIQLTGTLDTPIKRYDLMQSVNARGTYLCSQACLPHLIKATNPHVVTLSPPLSMSPKWFKNHVAYTMSKYGMSMCTLGMAAEFQKQGVAVNSMWPKTTIATAAIEVNFPKHIFESSRKPAIVADAVYALVTTPSSEITGQFLIDEDFLRSKGMTDFEKYAMKPGATLCPDFFFEN